MSGNIDLDLGPDFATRVLEAADRLVARRRFRRMAGASILCVGIAGAGVWLGVSTSLKDTNPEFASASPRQAYKPQAYKESGPTDSGNSADPLSWFFPDAEPLARYTADDSSDDGDTSAGALFTDDE